MRVQPGRTWFDKRTGERVVIISSGTAGVKVRFPNDVLVHYDTEDAFLEQFEKFESSTLNPSKQRIRLRHDLIKARGIEPGVRVTDLLDDGSAYNRSFGYVDRVTDNGLLIVIRDDAETKRLHPGFVRTVRYDGEVLTDSDRDFLKKARIEAW